MENAVIIVTLYIYIYISYILPTQKVHLPDYAHYVYRIVGQSGERHNLTNKIKSRGTTLTLTWMEY